MLTLTVFLTSAILYVDGKILTMSGCRSLSIEEMDKLIGMAGSVRNRAIIGIGLYTGLRISEILALRISDVYLNNQIVDYMYVRKGITKGKNIAFSTPINIHLRDILLGYINSLTSARDGYLFVSRVCSGKPLTRFQGHKILKQAFAKAGIDESQGPLGTHVMRKTFANRVYKALRHDLVATKVALRHQHLSSTEKYLEPNKDIVNAAIMSL